jgi:uncharacterized repeat protein (TIGR01451 family)
VSVPANAEGLLSSSATISDPNDPAPGNNTKPLITPIRSEADLAVSLNDLPDPAFSGQVFTYTVLVANNGPSMASSVIVTDTLPSDVTYKSSIPSTLECSCEPSDGKLICKQAGLAPASNLQVTVAVTASATISGTITNQVDVSATTTDTNTGNNFSSKEIRILPPITLAWTSPVATGNSFLAEEKTIKLEVDSSDIARTTVYFYRWDPIKREYIFIGMAIKSPFSIIISRDSLNIGWNEMIAIAKDAYGPISSRQRIWLIRLGKTYLPLVHIQ